MIVSQHRQIRATVVVPVRNRPDLLNKALQSLAKQRLNNGDFELIVCDDGSTDDVGSVVARFDDEERPKMSLLTLQPSGPGAARNAGIRAAVGDIVVFVDSDVEVSPDFLESLVTALEKKPDWAGAEGRLVPIGGEEGLLWDAPASEEGGRYHTAAIAYRRDILKAVGGFDETFKLPACEDVELAVRVLQHGRIGFVREAVAYHPRRRVTATTHLKWRHHWRYETILAVRYGILAFPTHSVGRFPRSRVLLSALVTLPGGRGLNAIKQVFRSPRDAGLAAWYALVDVACGFSAVPDILFAEIPERKDYLATNN